MTGTTPKKGRPTPAAPQNRRRPVAPAAADTSAPALSPEQEARAIQRARYSAYRKVTRPFRRAFRGIAIDQRMTWKHGAAAQALLVRDGQRVREYVRDQLGGVEEVARIAQGLGIKRGRVRLILAKGLER